jgi:DNA-binding MarR family transcriptional regulator
VSGFRACSAARGPDTGCDDVPVDAHEDGEQVSRVESGGRDPEQVSPAILIMALGRTIRDRTDKQLHKQGLSLRHLSALGHLSRSPGMSYSELARRAGVTVQSMQATLAQLEEGSFVERRTKAGRGRAAELHVTVAGAEVLGNGQHVLDTADDGLMGGLSNEERSLLVDLLMRAWTNVGTDPESS